MKENLNDNNYIEINEIKNITEKDILLFLNNNQESYFGNILKSLAIPVDKGQKIISSMLDRNLIKYKENTRLIKLNVNLK